MTGGPPVTGTVRIAIGTREKRRRAPPLSATGRAASRNRGRHASTRVGASTGRAGLLVAGVVVGRGKAWRPWGPKYSGYCRVVRKQHRGEKFCASRRARRDVTRLDCHSTAQHLRMSKTRKALHQARPCASAAVANALAFVCVGKVQQQFGSGRKQSEKLGFEKVFLKLRLGSCGAFLRNLKTKNF